MSQQNVEIVRRAYEAINSRDYSAIWEIAHPYVIASSRAIPVLRFRGNGC